MCVRERADHGWHCRVDMGVITGNAYQIFVMALLLVFFFFPLEMPKFGLKEQRKQSVFESWLGL